MAAQDDNLIHLARVVTDERPLQKCIKKFYKLAQLRSSGVGGLDREELEAHHAQFLLELDGLELMIMKGQNLREVSNLDIENYRRTVDDIEASRISMTSEIQSLSQELSLAQEDRRNKIEYDAIASEASKIPSRATSVETINRLAAEIASLNAEQKQYAETWANRKKAFDEIVSNLEVLKDMIQGEREEQERRQALGDEDAEAQAQESQQKEESGNDAAEAAPTAKADQNNGTDPEKSEAGAATTSSSLDPNAPAFKPSSSSSSSTTSPQKPAPPPPKPKEPSRFSRDDEDGEGEADGEGEPDLGGDAGMVEDEVMVVAGNLLGLGDGVAKAGDEDASMEDGEEKEVLPEKEEGEVDTT